MVSCFSSRCKFVVAEDLLSCSNELCPGKGQVFSASTGFDLLVDLTDHTGTLQSCSLRSPAAEKFLGCTVSTCCTVYLSPKERSFAVTYSLYFMFRFCYQLTIFVMLHVSDRGVHQIDWWPTNYNEVEISFREVQSLREGTRTFSGKRGNMASNSCVNIILYCLTDSSFH